MFLDKRLKELLISYEERIVALEDKIAKLEAAAKPAPKKVTKTEES